MRKALAVLAAAIAAAGALAVAVAGFVLSFDSTTAVARAAHISEGLAPLMPASIDGAIAIAVVAVMVLRQLGHSARYPWSIVIIGALISVACNGLHATGAAREVLTLPAQARFAVSAIPPVMLALSVHLLVVLLHAYAEHLASQETAASGSRGSTEAAVPPGEVGGTESVAGEVGLRAAYIPPDPSLAARSGANGTAPPRRPRVDLAKGEVPRPAKARRRGRPRGPVDEATEATRLASLVELRRALGRKPGQNEAERHLEVGYGIAKRLLGKLDEVSEGDHVREVAQ